MAALLCALIAVAPQVRLGIRVVSGGSQSLITSSDITYTPGEYYVLYNSSGNTPYGHGLALRLRDDETRFLSLEIGSVDGCALVAIQEWSLEGLDYGEAVMPGNVTHTWDGDVFGGGADEVCFNGRNFRVTWDEANARAWIGLAISYLSEVEPSTISVRTLNDNNTTSNYKRVSLEGIPAKQTFGSCIGVPAAFQASYSVGPFVCGFGGVTSNQAAGPASLGPTMFFIPDVSGYSHEDEIPAGSIKTAMTFGAGSVAPCTTADDYANDYAACDRGWRLTVPKNYGDYDGGGAQPVTLGTDRSPSDGTVDVTGTTVTLNTGPSGRTFATCPAASWPTQGVCWWPGLTMTIDGSPYVIDTYVNSTTITLTTSPGAKDDVDFETPSPYDALANFEPEDLNDPFFLSPAPDGKARMTTVDGDATSCWFSQGSKTGYLTLWSLGAGNIAYADASIGSTSAAIELHIYSNATLAAGIAGSVLPYNVRPDEMIDLTEEFELGAQGVIQNGAANGYGHSSMSCNPANGDIWIRLSSAETDGGVGSADRLYRFNCAACAAPSPMPWPVWISLALVAAVASRKSGTRV